MQTVSDYIVVTDKEIQLSTSTGDRDHTFTFSVPANIDTSQNAVAIWQFEAEGLHPEAKPESLEWTLHVNRKELLDITHHLNRFNALQKVFPGSDLHAGEGNHSTVKVLGGTGVIKFSSFVIHIQVHDGSPQGDALPPGDGLPAGGGDG